LIGRGDPRFDVDQEQDRVRLGDGDLRLTANLWDVLGGGDGQRRVRAERLTAT
jgi:hypothetical protein